MAMFVRLLPVDRRRGAMVEAYYYKGVHYKGGVRPVWYEVDLALANELSALKQLEHDPYSRQLFQVESPENKQAIDERESGLSIFKKPERIIPPIEPQIQQSVAGGRAEAIPDVRELRVNETPAASLEAAPAPAETTATTAALATEPVSEDVDAKEPKDTGAVTSAGLTKRSRGRKSPWIG